MNLRLNFDKMAHKIIITDYNDELEVLLIINPDVVSTWDAIRDTVLLQYIKELKL